MTEDERSKQFGEFCDHLTRLAPMVRVVREEGEPNEVPAIQIRPGLGYHAIPLGTELEPFLEALVVCDEKSYRVPVSIRTDIEKLDLPAMLKLYVSQQCPFCPNTVRQLVPLTTASELIQLAIIDCTLFPEMAKSKRIQSVPTLLLDEQLRWTGALQLEELLEMMTNRDPSRLSPSSLERIIKEGNASQVTEMMLDKESIFPAFIDLLTHEKLFVRLGAMAIIEEIADRRSDVAAQVIEPLWDRFHQAGNQVKGDIVYVLGQSGNDRIVPRLEAILREPHHPEVKEAAKEALEEIARNRQLSP
jgi:hypothetical protein